MGALVSGAMFSDCGFSVTGVSVGRSLSGAPPRGNVTSFSMASARRLRMFLLTHVSDGLPLSATCTLRTVRSPDDWRARVDAFGKRIARAGGCFVWRVELQRRGVPHLHLVAWRVSADEIRRAWLGVWGLRDGAHRAHAVYCEQVDDDSGRWYAYLCGHGAKHKQAQLGWVGRQWGVVGRSRFRRRSLSFVSASHQVAGRAVRMFNTAVRFFHLPCHPLGLGGGLRFVGPSYRDFLAACFERSRQHFEHVAPGRDST